MLQLTRGRNDSNAGFTLDACVLHSGSPSVNPA